MLGAVVELLAQFGDGRGAAVVLITGRGELVLQGRQFLLHPFEVLPFAERFRRELGDGAFRAGELLAEGIVLGLQRLDLLGGILGDLVARHGGVTFLGGLREGLLAFLELCLDLVAALRGGGGLRLRLGQLLLEVVHLIAQFLARLTHRRVPAGGVLEPRFGLAQVRREFVAVRLGVLEALLRQLHLRLRRVQLGLDVVFLVGDVLLFLLGGSQGVLRALEILLHLVQFGAQFLGGAVHRVQDGSGGLRRPRRGDGDGVGRVRHWLAVSIVSHGQFVVGCPGSGWPRGQRHGLAVRTARHSRPRRQRGSRAGVLQDHALFLQLLDALDRLALAVAHDQRLPVRVELAELVQEAGRKPVFRQGRTQLAVPFQLLCLLDRSVSPQVQLRRVSRGGAGILGGPAVVILSARGRRADGQERGGKRQAAARKNTGRRRKHPPGRDWANYGGDFHVGIKGERG